jgi:hypothetical protein
MMSTVQRLAALSVACFLATGAAAGERLKADAITGLVKGATFDGNYRDGGFFTETYATDGTIRYADGRGTDMGTWSVDRDMFCTFYEGQDGACFYVEQESANCFRFFEPKVEGSGDIGPRDEWTSEAWDRSKPSTCTVSREQSI